ICGDLGKMVMHGSSLRVFDVKEGLRAHSNNAAGMWDKPETELIEVDIPEGGGTHQDITRNFCRAILQNEPLLTPGNEGLWAVELINAVILSGRTGKPVDLPVNRQEYDRLLQELARTSKSKDNVREQRVTDPHYT